MEVEINFLETPTVSMVFSKFSLRAAGQRGLMSTKHSPLARSIDRQNAVKLQCGFVLGQPFPTKHVSILTNFAEIDFFALRWFGIAPLAPNSFRLSKQR